MLLQRIPVACGLVVFLLIVLPLWLGAAIDLVSLTTAFVGSTFGLLLAVVVFVVARYLCPPFPAFALQANILEAVAASTPDAIFVKDAAGRYLFLNETALALIGKTAAETLGKTDADLFGEERAALFRTQDERVMHGGQLELEERLLQIRGETRAYLVSKSPYRNAVGTVIGIIGISRDITDRQRAAEALRASEERYRSLVELAPDGIAVFQHGQVVYINRSAVRLLKGDSPADFLGLPLNDYVHPDDLAASIERQRAALQEQNIQPMREIRIRAKDGTYVTLEVCSGPCQLNGQPALQVVARDITARKEAEQSLRASEARYRALVENSADALFINRGGTIVYANPAFVRLIGATQPEEVLGKSPFDFLHPTFHAPVRERIDRLVEQRQPAPRMHQQYVRLDGQIVDVEVTGVPIVEDGEPAIEVVLRDITERRQAEERLRQSYAFCDAIIRNAAEGIIVSRPVPEHPHAFVTVWNERMVEITGYTLEEINTVGWFHAMYPQPEQRAYAQARYAAVRSGTELRAEDRAIRHKDGTIRYLSVSSTALELGDGTIALMGMIQDVTSRQQAEQALRASEERYRQLVDVLPNAVSVFTEGRLTFCNPALLRLLEAASFAELQGQSAQAIVDSEYHGLIHDWHEQMRRTGQPSPPTELKLRRLDGRTVPVYAVAVPLSQSDPFTVIAVHSDLTEREQSAQLIRSVMQSVPDAMVTFDENGQLLSANPATTRIFGYDEGDLIGHPVRRLLPEADDASLRPQQGPPLERQGRRRDGTWFPLEMSVSAFTFNNRPRFTAVLRDITQRRQLESQVLQAQKTLAIGRLAGGIAHDFNNLLTVINGHTDLLLLALAADDVHRPSCEAIHEAGVRAARLTAQLLAYGRQALIEPKLLPLAELIDSTTRLLQPLLGANITLATTSATDTPSVRVDRGQLEQVVMNLVLNARDAMPAGGTIHITTERRVLTPLDLHGLTQLAPGVYAQLCVRDNGGGMSAQVMARIFEPFFTTKDVGRGTGLGLAVVEGIIAQAGGYVSVQSQIGCGTTFTVWLPAAS